MDLERETLHVMHEQRRAVFVETRTVGDDRSPTQLARYLFADHIESARLELDADARIISLEEF